MAGGPDAAPRAQKQPWIGAGLIMAASGIGASDIIIATVGGATHGARLLWALALGAFLKFLLSEGLARWQLATGTTALEGWARHLPRWVLPLFLAYLAVWSVAVSGALVSGCGLAVENLSGGAVPRSWGGLAHAAVAFALIVPGRMTWFMQVMRPLIAVMFVSIIVCAALTFREPLAVARGLFIPGIPANAGTYVLSLIGGIGGSVTLLSYNYLLRDEGRVDARNLRAVRWDLAVAYLLTAVFGLSVMLIANRVFFTAGVAITDGTAVTRMAAQLGELLGPAGFYIYSLGFWAAVVASLVGVWQTVPGIFADGWALWRKLEPQAREQAVRSDGVSYRAALVFMAVASVPFALLGRPVLVVVVFTVVGSFFVPFLAATLLYLNNRVAWPAAVRHNGPATNALLWLVLLLFVAIGTLEISALIHSPVR